MNNRSRAFISYSHADAEYLTRLKVHLAPYIREQKVDVWDDTRITPGARWKEEIKQAMALAKIAILLISADFLASEFITQNELPPLLDAAEQQGLLVLSVILSPCAFEKSKLANYQSLNPPSSPLIKMARWEQEAIWARLAKLVTDALTNEKPSHIDLPPESNSHLGEAKIPVEMGIRTNAPDSQLASQESITQIPTRKKRSFSWKATFGGLFLVALLLVSSVFFIQGGLFRSNQPLRQATSTPKNHLTPTATPLVALSYDVAVTKSGVQFGFDTQHTHFNPYEQALTISTARNLKKVWIAQAGDMVYSSPSVANGIVYVGSRVGSSGGRVSAFKVNGCSQSCQPLWSVNIGYQVDSSPAIFNGKVYVSADDKKLYAFNATTGEQIWATPPNGGYAASPTIADGVVYIGTDDGTLHAFDAGTGTVKWSSPVGVCSIPSPGCSVHSPAVANGTIYVGSVDGNLYAFDAGNGSKLWAAPTNSPIDTSPAVAGNKVYVRSHDGMLYAFDIATHQKLWAVPIYSSTNSSSSSNSSPAVANDIVYIGSDDGKLYAFDAQKGTKKWFFSTHSSIYSSPTVANNVVYVGSLDKNLYAIGAETGTLLWNYSTNGEVRSSPSVANGTVYVGSADGKLYTFHL